MAREVFKKSREAKSRQEVRKIAYKTAKEQNVKMPRSWIQNESAGVDWCLNFLKKYPYLDFLIKNSKRVVKKEQRFECCVCDEIFYELSEFVLCESCCQVKCVHCYNPSKCLQRKLMDEVSLLVRSDNKGLNNDLPSFAHGVVTTKSRKKRGHKNDLLFCASKGHKNDLVLLC